MERRSRARTRRRRASTPDPAAARSPRLPPGRDAALETEGRRLRLTNLDKPFWPRLGLVKRDLLQFYADIAPAPLARAEGTRLEPLIESASALAP